MLSCTGRRSVWKQVVCVPTQEPTANILPTQFRIWEGGGRGYLHVSSSVTRLHNTVAALDLLIFAFAFVFALGFP